MGTKTDEIAEFEIFNDAYILFFTIELFIVIDQFEEFEFVSVNLN